MQILGGYIALCAQLPCAIVKNTKVCKVCTKAEQRYI